ncbi:MAG: metal-dependent hydrolase [Sphingorhabdus sp.]
MDNITHSLVGALAGQMGLKCKSGLAMPTLILAANIPDVDAVAVLMGDNTHLAIRRGLTHGPLAMLVLPLVLWAAMISFDAWQLRRGKRPEQRLPLHKGWLLAMAYIGCATHPAFDWLNSYGIRLLEPFSNEWFAGDSIFIIDIWILIIAGSGVWVSLRHERLRKASWHRPAVTAFTVLCTYILANGWITGKAELEATQLVEQAYDLRPTEVVANPVPVRFWAREMLWRSDSKLGARYGSGNYSVFEGVNLLEIDENDSRRLKNITHANFDQADVGKLGEYGGFEVGIAKQAAVQNKNVRAFLFWSRMPILKTDGKFLVLTDQRFNNQLTRNAFKLELDVSH